ncbi:uncharacterized protein [Rutidosis leptorrhynchoides]|uniref:uncharacterized protein n=1 Tax=Rutidosis leptorrhynchoides TaxID=125765 RepID=UPI003A990218
MCNKDKQDEIKDFIKIEKISVCAIVETHLKPKNIDKVCNFVFDKWDWISNVSFSQNSCRIVIGWDRNKVNVMVMQVSRQVILCMIETTDKVSKMYCSFVYASNFGNQRKCLWNDLRIHSRIAANVSWCLMGDFNITRKASEHSSGCSHDTEDMIEFNKCVNDIEVDDIGSSGFHFTWTKSLKNPNCSILRKLDRIMCNETFISTFPQAYGVFLPFLVSDHSPAVLNVPNGISRRKKSFRFMNHVANKVQELKEKLVECQTAVEKSPHDPVLRKDASDILVLYELAKKDESTVLKQKAKIKWLSEGDRNTKFFHSILKGRKQKSRIDNVCDEHGNNYTGTQVGEQFVNHFRDFLGNSSQCMHIDKLGDIFHTRLNDVEALDMVCPISDEEIKRAMFDIDEDKAAGPDGYTSCFFKKAWSIIGRDICLAIKEFFDNGKLLRELNATLIALIPKMDTPNKVLIFVP